MPFGIFDSVMPNADDLIGRLASRAGVNWHVDLHALLRNVGLTPLSVEGVNLPRVSSVVVCRKP